MITFKTTPKARPELEIKIDGPFHILHAKNPGLNYHEAAKLLLESADQAGERPRISLWDGSPVIYIETCRQLWGVDQGADTYVYVMPTVDKDAPVSL